VWVETDAPCEVEVLGHRARTFSVMDHHYALVRIDGLTPGTTVPYEVHLDGVLAWPALEGLPPSVIRVPAPEAPLHVAFGSCRVCAPNTGPEAQTKDEDKCGRGPDALRALAQRMAGGSPDTWPDLIVMLGRPGLRRRAVPGNARAGARAARHHHPAGRDGGRLRGIHRALPRGMGRAAHALAALDGAERDDLRRPRRPRRLELEPGVGRGHAGQRLWDRRIVGASPPTGSTSTSAPEPAGARSRCALRPPVKDVGDATAILRDFAFRADREVSGAMWSYARDVGGVRLVMIDSRAGRGARSRPPVDGRCARVGLIEEHATGEVEHLLIGTSLPLSSAPTGSMSSRPERGVVRRRVGPRGGVGG
jgi:hypothetical protein